MTVYFFDIFVMPSVTSPVTHSGTNSTEVSTMSLSDWLFRPTLTVDMVLIPKSVLHSLSGYTVVVIVSVGRSLRLDGGVVGCFGSSGPVVPECPIALVVEVWRNGTCRAIAAAKV